MICPKCGEKTTVKDTVTECGRVYRRRVCKKCNKEYYTTEEMLSNSRVDFSNAIYAYQRYMYRKKRRSNNGL